MSFSVFDLNGRKILIDKYLTITKIITNRVAAGRSGDQCDTADWKEDKMVEQNK